MRQVTSEGNTRNYYYYYYCDIKLFRSSRLRRLERRGEPFLVGSLDRQTERDPSHLHCLWPTGEGGRVSPLFRAAAPQMVDVGGCGRQAGWQVQQQQRWMMIVVKELYNYS